MGELKLAAVFSDRCVLQRGKNIAVFGTGNEGEAVEAVLTGKVLGTEEVQTSRGRCRVKDGRFELALPALREGLDHTLTVASGEERIVLKDIAIGEVWLAGGQSNMELELQNCAERDALNRPADKMLRFYYTQKLAYMDDAFFRAEEKTAWECFGDPRTKYWSAVGYFFAEKLLGKLQVPVGIIGCNWGGTSASAWIPQEALAESVRLQAYLDPYFDAMKGKTEQEQLREYEEYTARQEEFDKKVEAICGQQPDIGWDDAALIVGGNPYPGPMVCCSPQRPGGLYECMVRRIMPYSLKGFLYYQGESDEHLPHLYYELLCRLIRQWREDWGDDELPFLIVQLPMHRYKNDPDFRNWCLIREAQDRAYRTVRHTGMACAIDLGEFNEIHPKAKREVGERLTAQALEVAYGLECPEAKAPRFAAAERADGEMLLYFAGAEGALEFRPGIAADDWGFEVAGADGVYVPADKVEMQLIGTGPAIRVGSAKVPEPVFARYLWTNYGPVALFGKNGLPLAPFRTDRRDGFAPLTAV